MLAVHIFHTCYTNDPSRTKLLYHNEGSENESTIISLILNKWLNRLYHEEFNSLDSPDSPDNSDNPDSPDSPDNPDNPDNPDSPDNPISCTRSI